MKTRLSFLFIAGLVPQAAFPASCDTLVTGVANYLKADPANYVYAIVASNKPGYYLFTNQDPQVTYSKINLSTGFGYLLTKTTGTLYFNDFMWGPNYPGNSLNPPYPFSPASTVNMTLTVSPAGAVTLKPSNSSQAQTFTAACNAGLMSGQMPVTTIGYPQNPGYLITFLYGKTPAPPK